MQYVKLYKVDSFQLFISQILCIMLMKILKNYWHLLLFLVFLICWVFERTPFFVENNRAESGGSEGHLCEAEVPTEPEGKSLDPAVYVCFVLLNIVASKMDAYRLSFFKIRLIFLTISLILISNSFSKTHYNKII